MAAKKRGLGRGLDALLGMDSGPGPSNEAGEGELRSIAVGQIQPGRYQPRTGMDPDRLDELAASIKAQGLIQPIVVRAIGGGRYEIIAGERRWRAAQHRRAGRTAGGGARGRRPRHPGDGADREHPARGPQSAGGSAPRSSA